MSLTEQKRKKKSDLDLRFSERFEQMVIHNTLCFRKPDGGLFRVCPFPGEGALVIEYAENDREAELNRFEDGDLFYLEDMDEETMFQAMLNEISS